MGTARRAKIPSAYESLVDEFFHSQPDDPEDIKFLTKADRLHHRQVGLIIPWLAAGRRPCCVGIIRPVGKLALTTFTPLCSYFLCSCPHPDFNRNQIVFSEIIECE